MGRIDVINIKYLVLLSILFSKIMLTYVKNTKNGIKYGLIKKMIDREIMPKKKYLIISF